MKTILAFGDSNFWGEIVNPAEAPNPGLIRFPREMRFAGRLQALLGTEYFVIEDALPGRMAMMDDPLNRLRRGYEQLEIALEVHAPVDLLVLQLGANENRQMLNLSSDMIACSVGRLGLLARNHAFAAARTLLIAPHPMHPRVGEMKYGFLFGPDAYEKSLGFSDAFRALARQLGADFLDCAPLNFELNEIDGVHYSANDIRRLAEAAHAKIVSMYAE